MNRDEHKLEQLIRQRLNSRHTEFNEEHWLRARKLIDADRKRKKRKWFFFAGTLIATISCVAFFIWLDPGTATETGIITPQQTSAPSSSQTTPEVSADQHAATPASEAAPESPNTTRESRNNGAPEDHYATGSPTTDHSDAIAAAEADIEAVAHDATPGSASSTPARQPKRAIEKEKLASATTKKSTRKEQVNNKRHILHAAPSASQSFPDKQEQQTENILLPATHAKKRTNESGHANEVSETPNPLVDGERERSLASLNGSFSSSGNSKVSFDRQDEEKINTLHRNAVLLAQPKYTDKLEYNWAPAPDTTERIPGPLKPLRARDRFMAAELGATYFNPGKNMLQPVNFSAGIMYHYGITKKTGINAGIFYSRIHQHLPERTFKSSMYDFGKNVSYISLQTRRLDYIEVPLQLFYSPVPKHMVRAGISYMQLVQSGDLVTRAGNKTKENGYVEAINNRDVLITLGYTCFVKVPFYISLTGYYGLNDISDNNAFGSVQHNRNAGLKFSIGYTLPHVR